MYNNIYYIISLLNTRCVNMSSFDCLGLSGTHGSRWSASIIQKEYYTLYYDPQRFHFMRTPPNFWCNQCRKIMGRMVDSGDVIQFFYMCYHYYCRQLFYSYTQPRSHVGICFLSYKYFTDIVVFKKAAFNFARLYYKL